MEDWDWEVLHHSDKEKEVETVKDELYDSSSSSSSHGAGVFRSDYFSLGSSRNFAAEGEESDKPSWIDPSAQASDSSDHSDCNSSNPLLLIQPHSDCAIDCDKLGLGSGEIVQNTASESAIETETVIHSSSMDFQSAVASDKGFASAMEDMTSQPEVLQEEDDDQKQKQYELDPQNMMTEEEKEEEKETNPMSDEKRRVVWWRVPLEVLRYCVLRVSPVWSLSMAAAAVMGFVLLRRRYLYKMKRKNQGLQLKVTVDDKKVSQFMSRAARINEAFSVVKRVPIIRPSLPAPGFAPWPVVSLR